MHIFSVYKQGESDIEYDLYFSIISQYQNRKISHDECINLLVEFYEKNSTYIRPLVAALVLNLKNLRNNQIIESNLAKYLMVVHDYLDKLSGFPKPIEPIILLEYAGCLARYGSVFNIKNNHKQLRAPNYFRIPFIYRPEPSGFFSVLENIINAEIYANLNGSDFYIDLSGDWWRYSTPFQIIFPRFKYKKTFTPIFYKRLSMGRARRWFFSQPKEAWHQYNHMKMLIYKEIYDSIEFFLKNQNINWNLSLETNAIGIYVRRGDKLDLEDIHLDDDLVIQNINRIMSGHDCVYLSSDDTAWLKNKFAKNKSKIIFDDDNNSGYFFGNEHADDHIHILKKYMRMVNIEKFSGDSGSNLINAIVFTRILTKKEPIFLNDYFSTDVIPLI